MCILIYKLVIFNVFSLVQWHKRYNFFKTIIYSLRRLQMAYCRNCMTNVLPHLRSNNNVNNVNNENSANDANAKQWFVAKRIHPVPMLVQKLSKNCKYVNLKKILVFDFNKMDEKMIFIFHNFSHLLSARSKMQHRMVLLLHRLHIEIGKDIFFFVLNWFFCNKI